MRALSKVDARVEISNRPALTLLQRVLDRATPRFEDGVTCVSAAL